MHEDIPLEGTILSFLNDKFMGIKIFRLPVFSIIRGYLIWMYGFWVEIKWYYVHKIFTLMALACLAFIGLKIGWKFGRPFITYGLI